MKLNQLVVLLGAFALVGCEDLGDDDKETGFLDTDSGLVDTEETDVIETDETEESPPPTWNEGFWEDGDWENFVDCAAGQVVLTAETKGFGGDTELYITQTDDFGDDPAWGESHTFEEIDATGSGDSAFSTFQRTLTTGASLEEQTADQSTLFMCAEDDPPETRAALDPSSDEFEATFALAVWDEDLDPTIDPPSDCIVFGQNPDGLLADPTADERIDVPDWLSDDNCRVVE